MRRRSRSSASPAAVFARIRFSRRCATSASACRRSRGGVWPTSTRALFCRASSCASSSERCCTVTLASVALSVQYACFTAAVVWTTDSRTRSSELSRLRLATIVCWRARSILRSLQQRLRHCQLEAGLQSGIEARQRIVGRLARRVPRQIPAARAPRQPLPDARRREQIVGVDAALAEQKIGRRRDIARSADHRRKHRHVGALALRHARGLDLGAEANACEIRIVFNGPANRLIDGELKGFLAC